MRTTLPILLALALLPVAASAGPAQGPPAEKPLALFGQADADRLATPARPARLSFTQSGGDSRAPRRWWPVLASAVVPGLGEALTGHLRGYALIAADAALWYGVVDQRQLGDDKEDEYIAWADLHWSEDRWSDAITDGPGGIYTFDQYFPEYSTKEDVPLYVTREADEREYYENAGKWDVFAWGWREYWDPSANPDNELYEPCGGNPPCADPDFEPPTRERYLELRGESNDAYRRRDNFKNIALLLRVASFLEMAYLEGFIGNRGGGDGDAGARWATFLAPAPEGGTAMGLKVGF